MDKSEFRAELEKHVPRGRVEVQTKTLTSGRQIPQHVHVNPTPTEVINALWPFIIQQVEEERGKVKDDALNIIKTFFPDPHQEDEECSDCMMVRLLSSDVDKYVETEWHD